MTNALLDGHLMIILAFLCNFLVCVIGCRCQLRANRSTLPIPEGGSVSLLCVVQDCKNTIWTADWGRTENGFFTPLIPSPRLHLSNITFSDKTHLLVKIQELNQTDSGGYQCRLVEADSKCTIMGHIQYVNVTTDESKQRKFSHRLLVCAAAGLCFSLALGLACFLYFNRMHAPPVPPRFRGHSTAQVKLKEEVQVVYTAVVLNSPRQQKRPQSKEPVVYSSLNFSVV